MPRDSQPGEPGDPSLKSSRLSYEEVKAKFETIAEKQDKIAKLRGEVANEWKAIEDGGINRGVAKMIHRMRTKSAATLAAEEEERRQLFDFFIQPRIDDAAAGSDSEG